MIGESAAPARPMLEGLLLHKDQDVQDLAFEALGRIVLDASLDSEFSGAISDKNPGVRAAGHAQARQWAIPLGLGDAVRQAQLRNPALYRAAVLQRLDNHSDDPTISTIGRRGPYWPNSDPTATRR